MISLSACWWKTDETPQRDSLHSKGFAWFAYNLSTPQVFKVAQTSEEHMIRLTAEVISCFFLSFYHSFPMKCAFAWNFCPAVLHLCVMCCAWAWCCFWPALKATSVLMTAQMELVTHCLTILMFVWKEIWQKTVRMMNCTNFQPYLTLKETPSVTFECF